MTERLKQIIAEKTGGNQRKFCELMGWTPQYLNNILTSGKMGITPVLTVLKNFDNIDARWFLTGQGSMYPALYEDMIRKKLYDRIEEVIMFGRYVPVMSREQQRGLAEFAISGKPLGLTASDITMLEEKLKSKQETEESAEQIVERSIKESIVCKRSKALK